MREASSLLKERGLRSTRRRLAILEILSFSPTPLSVEEIYEQLRKNGVPLSLSTVYRGVEGMEVTGLLRRLYIGDGSRMLFEICGEGHHHYLRCLSCQAMVPLPHCPVGSLAEAENLGYEILGHRLDVFGYCSTCRKDHPKE